MTTPRARPASPSKPPFESSVLARAADIGTVARFASAFAFLFVFAVVLGSAGCGQRFDNPGAGAPPTQSELASQALAALEEAGSAHVVLDAEGGSVSGTDAQLGVHFEGDASLSTIAGDGEVRFPGGTLGARLLVNQHTAYVRFMGVWYEAGSGLDDVLAKAKAQSSELLAQLSTPAGLAKFFTQFVEGDVAQGPDLDGVSTWEFDGRLRGDTLADFATAYGGFEVSTHDRAVFEKIAATSRVVVVVGQEDHLPRKIELTLDQPNDVHFDSQELESGGGGKSSLTLRLSGFGEDVSFTAPKGAKPLDQLFDQLFGTLG